MAMVTVEITLHSADGKRLTVYKRVPVRNTPYENQAMRLAEVEINAHPDHGKYGPWKSHSSKFLN